MPNPWIAVLGWEVVMAVSAIVLNGEKGGQGIVAAFVAFNLMAGAVLLIQRGSP